VGSEKGYLCKVNKGTTGSMCAKMVLSPFDKAKLSNQNEGYEGMWAKNSLLAGMLLVLVFASSGSLAQQGQAKSPGQDPQQDRAQSEIQEREQLEYERRLREAASEQERERIRLEHQRKIQEQAKQKSKARPDMPSGGQGHGGPGGGGPKR